MNLSWNDISITKKIGIGIGTVVSLLGVISIITYLGVEGIVVDAREVIEGNKLSGVLAQKEVDQMNWVAGVNRLFTDESLIRLNVETDNHKSGLGKWLYSGHRKRAEKLVPELRPLFKAIEAPHNELYQSAININNVLKRNHGDLARVLSDHLAEHINWANQLNQSVAEEAGGMYIYQNQLQAASDKAIDLIQAIRAVNMPSLNQKQEVLKNLKQMRFGRLGDDYFFVLNTQGVVLMHPLNPSLKGKNLSNYEDENGNTPFEAVLQGEFNPGEGYTALDQSLFEGLDPAPMLIFSKKFALWDWVICASLHVDRTNSKLKNRVKDLAQGIPFKLDIELNPDQCRFGKFLSAPETKKLIATFPAIQTIMPKLAQANAILHRNAWEVETAINDMDMPWAMNILANKVQPTLAETNKLFEQAIDAETQLTQSRVNAENIFITKTIPAMDQVKHIMAEVQKTVRQKIMTDEQMLSHARKVRNQVLFMGILAIMIGCILIFTISRSISKPIIRGVDFAKIIAGKDLTQRLDIHQADEVGTLASALNDMSDNLHKIVTDVVTGVDTLTVSSTQLASVSEQIEASADQTLVKTQKVSRSSRNMSGEMDSVTQATQQANQNLQMIASAVEEMAATIQEVAINTEKGSATTAKAVATAGSVSVKVKDLNQAAEEINKVTQTIAEISGQTNLLALNATIEAARAGEAGKGFAVVAGEIKTLAQQTAEANQDISTKINGIQATAVESANAISSIADIINEINEIVNAVASSIEEQSVTTREISNNISDAANGLDEVNHRISRTSTASDDVTRDIVDVNSATESIASGSRQIRTSAEALSALAEELHKMMAQFTV